MATESTLAAARTLAHLARLVERASSDLSLPQYRILSLVARGDERATVLAGRLALTKPTVSALVDNLAERGLLERGTVEGDRRSVRLAVTDAGRASLAGAETAMADVLDALFGQMQRRDELLAGLAELGDVMRAEREQRIDKKLANEARA